MMKTGAAILLVGLGAALLVGGVLYSVHYYIARVRADEYYWTAAIGAFLLTVGAATLFVRNQQVPGEPSTRPPADSPVDTRIARRYEEKV